MTLAIRRHPHLLELSAWPWLERLSGREQRLVTLASVPGHEWDAIAHAGFDLVFLMGVWRRSPLGRRIAQDDEALRREYDRVLPMWSPADIAGSPYCIQDYVPDDRMGGWKGLASARRELNARGVGLIVDFVPNHTGFDHPWVTASADRYVLGLEEDARNRPDDFRAVTAGSDTVHVACARDPHFPPWRDVAQLNYFNPETRAAMISVLREIASHADGVRCDMAMLVLNDVFDRTWRAVLRDRYPVLHEEFWPEAIGAAADLLFVAEVYWDLEWTLQQQGFHFTYDKRLLDRLQAAPTRDVRGHLLAEPEYADRLVRFLENHDEPRSAAVFGEALPAAAATLATLTGMRFFFDGQLEGARLRAPVQLARWPEEEGDLESAALYQRLLATVDDPLFHDGEWRLLEVTPAGDTTFTDLLAWRWRLEAVLAVVVVNLGAETAQGHVDLASELPDGAWFDFHDRLTDERYRWTRESVVARGLYVRLQPGKAHLLSVSPDPPQ